MKPLTDEERRFCEYWMKSYHYLSTHLTDSRFTEETMLTMIQYEMTTRQRATVLERLFARYFKVRKISTAQAAINWVKANHAPDLFLKGIEIKNKREDTLGEMDAG